MLIGSDTVEWNGDRLRVMRDGVTVASGRWRGARIVERCGVLDPEDDAAAWNALELALRRDCEDFVAASNQAAQDERGVDVTQIDQMLRLTPADRLAVLDGERRSIAKLLGNAARD